MQDLTESELIERARSGSRSAFGALVAAYEDRLYRFLVTRARSPADAEDAMQECFVSAYRYIASYDDRWRFSTWLYRIALRELGKLPKQDDSGVVDVHRSAAAPDPLIECMALDDSQNLWLLARKLLSEDSFTALWLRYAEDLPVKDVAHSMGRSATWVKVVVHRAKKRLSAVCRRNDGQGEQCGDGAAEARENVFKCEVVT